MLRVSSRRRSVAVAGAVLCALTLAGVQTSAQAPAQTAAPSISGHAYVTVGDGSSQLMRGAEVMLTCASAEYRTATDSGLAALTTVGTRSETLLMQFLSTAGPSQTTVAQLAGAVAFAEAYLPRLSAAFYDQLTAGAVARTRTTFEGAYTFPDLRPGTYYVVARYATTLNDIIWRQLVTVTATAPVTLDLANFNGIDMKRTLRLDAVVQHRGGVDAMIARLYPKQRASFLAGQDQARQQALSAALPSALTRGAICQN